MRQTPKAGHHEPPPAEPPQRSVHTPDHGFTTPTSWPRLAALGMARVQPAPAFDLKTALSPTATQRTYQPRGSWARNAPTACQRTTGRARRRTWYSPRPSPSSRRHAVPRYHALPRQDHAAHGSPAARPAALLAFVAFAASARGTPGTKALRRAWRYGWWACPPYAAEAFGPDGSLTAEDRI